MEGWRKRENCLNLEGSKRSPNGREGPLIGSKGSKSPKGWAVRN